MEKLLMRISFAQKYLFFGLALVIIVAASGSVPVRGQGETGAGDPEETRIIEEGSDTQSPGDQDTKSNEIEVIDIDVRGNVRVEKELIKLIMLFK